ncbi:hypothetical protein E3N88_43576 [Mikania micrantha]|uniref:Uncharacterized protein n=1 Tax=Mikania micrantha TaxID=192012 RepID=A0A5N6LEJ3_9ASTR|nr:hypothetical protein E3N88_43576 [Mikania micrantha]
MMRATSASQRTESSHRTTPPHHQHSHTGLQRERLVGLTKDAFTTVGGLKEKDLHCEMEQLLVVVKRWGVLAATDGEAR